ncbi:MAG: DUF4476 domain-containing protein [Flavobacteriaceae bacterium]|nr:DUF4476 domain-containing protein [Flavobacteriaceae bacterium]
MGWRLNTPRYRAKIVFEDPTREVLEKTIYFPEQNSEVTYRIIEKKGKLKLRVFSIVPLPEVYVERLNQRAIVVVTEPIYTETVTTRTVVKDNTDDKFSMDVQIDGVGISVNVNIDDNINNEVVYEETVTTVSSSNHYVMQGYNGPIGCPWPMDEADFTEAKRTIAAKDWDETKLSLAKQIIQSNCLFADQVRDIAELMEWEENKLAFAKYAYDYTYDIGDYFKVSQIFEWEASTEELNEYISNR